MRGRIIQIKKMRWKRHAVLLVEVRNAYKIVVGKAEGKEHFQNLGIDGRTVSNGF